MQEITINRQQLIDFILDVGYQAKLNKDKVTHDLCRDFYEDVVKPKSQLKLWETSQLD